MSYQVYDLITRSFLSPSGKYSTGGRYDTLKTALNSSSRMDNYCWANLTKNIGPVESVESGIFRSAKRTAVEIDIDLDSIKKTVLPHQIKKLSELNPINFYSTASAQYKYDPTTRRYTPSYTPKSDIVITLLVNKQDPVKSVTVIYNYGANKRSKNDGGFIFAQYTNKADPKVLTLTKQWSITGKHF